MKFTNNKFKTTCSYCGVGCGIVVTQHKNGKIEVDGDPDHPANRGMLCSKGRNLAYVATGHAERILHPYMRHSKDHARVPVSWNAAFERTVAVFKTMIEKYGPDSVGFYVSGQCLTEEYYVINKLVKGFIQTNNIDTNSRLCMSSAVVGYKLSLGEDAVPVSYDDIELADCFYIDGANPAWCHPIIFRRIEQHKASNPHVKIIVADPRRTQSCSLADIHLQLNPGTDVYLNNAIARCLIENNWIDQEFINQHVDGYEQTKELVFSTTLSEAAEICGIAEDLIYETASYIGRSKGFISMWAMGLNQSAIGVNKNLSLINLSLLTGKIGQAGSGPFSLTGQPNAMGGREVGGLSNLLPAHRNLDKLEDREEVARFWNVASLSPKAGYTATEMFEALANDKLKAIWIICTNPLVSLPNAREVEAALKKARFVVVQDIFHSTITAEYADVILPAAGWLEKEGTMTNSDRRISYLPKVLDAPGEALPDAEIICKFAQKMGYHGFNYKSNEEIFREHGLLTQGTNIDISGLSYSELKNKGTVQWPYPTGNTKGTERLFTDKQFYTPNKKAKLHAVTPENTSEKPNGNYPLVLTSGRIRDQWHTMTRTGIVKKLNQHISEPFLEIHPEDANHRGIKQDDIVVVNSPQGEIRVKAQLTDSIKKGVVFAPMHWGKILSSDLARANNLVSKRIDPKSKEPDFKYSIVEVKKYIKEKQKIILIGAGAASFQFISTYRKLNSKDEIHVFSDEKYPFYNRVLLPDLVNGTKSWEQLQKTDELGIHKMNIQLHTENRIASISPDQKFVTDSKGQKHDYDILFLATGSRPNVPNNFQLGFDNIFKVRTRTDTDNILKTLHAGQSVVVVGGGLLGLEMVAAFTEIDIQCTLVTRVSKLMDRQLDEISSDFLKQSIEEKGVTIFTNDEVENIFKKDEQNLLVSFKSGRKVQCNAIVVALGTVPNIEIAKAAGLKTKRGVLVNSRMQTNYENIYAAGEIAEHNDTLYGITMVAEEQAEVAARYISGDITACFNGSVSMNILKFPGIELCSIGIAQTPRNQTEYEEITFIDRAARFYKKCIVHNDRLVGAILMGDKSEFTEYKSLIKSQIELSEKRLSLLRSGKPANPVKGKLVCSCNNVGEGNLGEEINKGYTDFNQLCQNTGAGMGCGSCKPEVKAILEQCLTPLTT